MIPTPIAPALRPARLAQGPRPRHILMTADAVGGVWDYALELIAGYEREQIAVTLAVLGPEPSAAQREQAARLPNLALEYRPCRLEWMEEPWQELDRAGEWLLALEARSRPDLIHLNSYCHGTLNWGAPALVVAHSCLLSWWEAVRRCPPPARWEHYARQVARGLAGAAMVVAPSAWMLASVRHHYSFRGPGAVVRNGRPAHRFLPAPKQTFLLMLGRLWDEAKNLAALDNLAARIPWPIYAAGDTRAPDGRVISALRVRRLGRLAPEQVAEWMSRAAIYVHPAWYEPFGLSVLEAALAGCALVLGDIPSLRELWDGVAWFVAPDDCAGLERILRALIGNPQLRADYGQRARRRALRLGVEPMARGYLALYQGLLDPSWREGRCES